MREPGIDTLSFFPSHVEETLIKTINRQKQ